MNSPAVVLLLALFSAGTLHQACGTQSVTALYGEDIVLPCNAGAPAPEGLMFVKWKYEKEDGSLGDLLLKQALSDQAVVQATDDYAKRVKLGDGFSLVISQATLSDQKLFTCMVVSVKNLKEYPVTVAVYKKPSSVEIIDKPQMLNKDKLSMVGTCVAASANPPAVVTWKKNGKALVRDEKAGTVITASLKRDPATGLSETSSTLQYTPTKEDASTVFTCLSTHNLTVQEVNLEPFDIHYPSEKISLQIESSGPIIEGGNVTLKCHADGNPPPNNYFFTVKGKKILVENSDNYTLTAISREDAGEYKCSLDDNEALEDSQTLVVNYLDLSLSSTGRIVKTVGDPFSVKMNISALGEPTVSWTKDRKAMNKPEFGNVTYDDAGEYKCEVSVTGLRRHQSFDLVVEGKPVITSLTERYDEETKLKVLTCDVEGVPQPIIQWNINYTKVLENSFNKFKTIHKISVVPNMNLTVTCSVSNKLGTDAKTFKVVAVSTEQKNSRESSDGSDDNSKIIVGVVAALIAIAAIAALIYWLYKKNSREGSWKIVDKEDRSNEEKTPETSQPV